MNTEYNIKGYGEVAIYGLNIFGCKVVFSFGPGEVRFLGSNPEEAEQILFKDLQKELTQKRKDLATRSDAIEKGLEFIASKLKTNNHTPQNNEGGNN